ncbi:hypothetical protein PMIN04_004355 [Paraphaeosphaeria minitans]
MRRLTGHARQEMGVEFHRLSMTGFLACGCCIALQHAGPCSLTGAPLLPHDGRSLSTPLQPSVSILQPSRRARRELRRWRWGTDASGQRGRSSAGNPAALPWHP